MTRVLLSAVRQVGRSQSLAVRLAKAVVVAILRRTTIVAPARLASGTILYVDLANTVGRSIWLRGDYSAEAPIVDLVSANLTAGDVFLDVGANVGIFSVIAGQRVGETGRVHSFEPLPRLAALLRRTVAANGLTNVSVVEAAVGRTSGRVSMAAMPDSAYSHVIEGATAIDGGHGGWRPIAVRSVTLDEYVEQIVGRTPRLIKMDIEGSEIEAVDGARRILSGDDAPDVICEVGEPHLARFGHTPTELFERFRSMGYRAIHPGTRQTMRVEDLSSHEYNVFFTKRHSSGST